MSEYIITEEQFEEYKKRIKQNSVDNHTVLEKIWLSDSNDFKSRIPLPTQEGYEQTVSKLFALPDRTCHVENSYYDALLDVACWELSCGHNAWFDVPKFCPECGARVIE